jgi:hypothetical protein
LKKFEIDITFFFERKFKKKDKNKKQGSNLNIRLGVFISTELIVLVLLLDLLPNINGVGQYSIKAAELFLSKRRVKEREANFIT